MKKLPLIALACLALEASAQSGKAPQAKFTPGYAAVSVQSTRQEQEFELVSFVAEPVNGEGITLRWVTGAEVPGCLFSVERSSDRMTWYPAFSQPGEGGTKGYAAYEVVDMAPITGVSYYRLVASAGTRQLEVSDEFAVDYAPAPLLQFSNDAVPGNFRVQGRGAISNLQVLNNRGQFIPMDLHYDAGQVVVNTTGLEPGTYFVQALVDGTPVLRSVTVIATGVIGG